MGNSVVKKSLFGNIPSNVPRRFEYMHRKIFYIPSGRGYSIPILKHCGHNNISSPNSLKIIYSHGNCEDIEIVDALCHHLAVVLNATVYAYEYCGYGLHQLTENSTKPSEENIYADATSVVDYVCSLTEQHSSVVVYGRSLGTAPAIYIASQRPQLGACILESPFLTPAKTVIQSKTSRTLLAPFGLFGSHALFPNERYIKEISIPILMIHGERDKIVPFSHSLELKNLALRSIYISTYWIKRAGHTTCIFLMVLEYSTRSRVSSLH